MSTVRVSFGVFSLMALASCASSVAPADDETWSFGYAPLGAMTWGMTGFIHRAGPGLWSGRPDGPFQILVLVDHSGDCGIIFTVDEDTLIEDARSGSLTGGSQALLTEGAVVRVAHRVVNQSCPGQSYAREVRRFR